MSGIFGKTIESLNSLLSPVTANLGLSTKYMFERCLSARTKGEEDWCFRDALETIQTRLAEPSVRSSTVKKVLGFVVFAELMGYRAEFAYIHAVKLAQQGSLTEKKVGYMVCVQLLKDSHPLSMLLVNTILKDLASRNMITISMALAATCHLISPDQASTVLPMVIDKLTHSNEYIRGKAVIVLHHFHRMCPTQVVHYFHRVHPLLGDSDPGVVALILQYLTDTSHDHPELASEISQSVVLIQEQILNGRLPKDYMHHGISAPWTQFTILRLLRQLHPPLLDVESILRDTLKAATAESTSNNNSTLSAAIAVECLRTILELNPTSTEYTGMTMSTVGHLLLSHNTNLRYEGLGLLQTLVSLQHVSLTQEQQAVILKCLQHSDNAIKLKSLHLLCAIADSSNAESICDQVIEFLRNHCTNGHLQSQLVTLGITLAEKFPSSRNHWHLASLLKLLPMAKEQSKTVQSKLKLSLLSGSDGDILKSSSPHRKVLSYLTRHSESKQAPTTILELYVWVLSNFHCLLSEENESESDVKTQVIALERITSLGNKILHNQIHGTLEIIPTEIHTLLYEIVDAARHLVETYFESIPSLEKFLQDVISASMTRVFGDAALRCACFELVNIISSGSELHKILPRPSPTCDAPDFTLSFLDDFVCSDLEKNGIPYKPLPVKPGSRAAIQLILESERNQGDNELSSSALVAAPCSLGSSELSLAGTDTANNGTGSISSVSSTDSRCWTFNSPTQDIPPTPVWTKDGRIKGDPTPDVDVFTPVHNTAQLSEPSDGLQAEVGPDPTISTWLKNSTDSDPLDDLQKDFIQTSLRKSPQCTPPS